MPAEKFEHRQLGQFTSVARPVALLLALLALKETAPSSSRTPVVFLSIYLIASLAVLSIKNVSRFQRVRIPVELDAVVLAVFIALTPTLPPFWLFYIFTVFALAARGRLSAKVSPFQTRPNSLYVSDAALLSVGAAVAVTVRAIWFQESSGIIRCLGLGLATYFAGFCVTWFGIRERTLISEHRLIESLLGAIRVEKGVAESVRLVLSELAREFDCERAALAICDEEIERLFVWKADQDRRHVIPPEVLPLSGAGAHFAEDLSHTICWNSLDGAGKGFGWERDTGASWKEMEAPPATARQQLGARSVMAVTVLSSGHPAGRMLLINSRGNFTRRDLRLFERIVRQLSVPLENVFLLRNLRTRAVEGERSRISRDLHDGILQTLLSLNIQLGVLRRKLPQFPDQVSTDLAGLEKTVREEGEELRQMVKDLRPLRLESADLREMMFGFAERCHEESGIAVDLFLEENDLRAPDRVCREVFQIYRESLNNIKKHARASHVVVKLWQDDTKIFLVVDDNGQGFSFSGRYNSEELDRLRLGPISIKERTRSVGGVLTVESNPGHGARLTIEIPLN